MASIQRQRIMLVRWCRRTFTAAVARYRLSGYGDTSGRSLTVEYTPSLGQPHFNLCSNSRGSFNDVQWDSQIAASGSGKSWQTLSLVASAPKLHLKGAGQSTDLSGLVARVSSTDKGFNLADFRIGESNSLVGNGGYTLANRTAWIYLDGRQWPIPLGNGRTMDINLNAWCDPTRIHLRDLYVNSGTLRTNVVGEYVFGVPKPMAWHLYFEKAAQAAYASAPQRVGGILRGNLDLEGTVRPLDLSLVGDAAGEECANCSAADWGFELSVGRDD